MLREEIPTLFSDEFNPGNWDAGHVVLKKPQVYILLVTLNKQGKGLQHRYHDYFLDEHLFVRDRELDAGKSAPFRYMGCVRQERHEGTAPMNVVLRLLD